MLFSLNFVKFIGNFCKVFAAYTQVRDSTDFLRQIADILLLLSTKIFFGISQKFPFLPFLKPKWSYQIRYEPRHAIMCLREINNVMRYDVVKSDVIISRRA